MKVLSFVSMKTCSAPGDRLIKICYGVYYRHKVRLHSVLDQPYCQHVLIVITVFANGPNWVSMLLLMYAFGVQQAYSQNNTLIRQDLSSALRILDNNWDDCREFALDYFRNQLTERDWTPDLLIFLCDSVRDDVQRLGRELLRQFFKQQQGEDYLLKLSQHPSHNVQLFASEFLHTYAGGKPDVIARLQLYFITVLSSINQGRIAKQRVLSFLLNQAQLNRAIAEQLAAILERQSVTVAIQDKAGFIQAMLELQQQYPDLKLPLTQARPQMRGYQGEFA